MCLSSRERRIIAYRVTTINGSARQRGAIGVIGLDEWIAKLEQCGFRCQYCHRDLRLRLCEISIDHVVPIARGGLNTIDNVAPSCRPCNHQKRDRLVGEYVHVDLVEKRRLAQEALTEEFEQMPSKIQEIASAEFPADSKPARKLQTVYIRTDAWETIVAWSDKSGYSRGQVIEQMVAEIQKQKREGPMTQKETPASA